MRKILVSFIMILSTLVEAKEPVKTISGCAKVIDGDTLKISDTKIRFAGVDAPELSQNCKRGKTIEPCGKYIKEMLEQAVMDKEVVCYSYGNDLYGRFLGECFVGDLNINKWLLREGLAVYYYNKNFKDYKILETLAKEEKNGIWSTKFAIPKDYRKQEKNRR